MSSAQTSAASPAPKPLSDKDVHVLAHAFACMKTQPEIDYDALAEKVGVKDGTAAYKVLWAIKKKLATHGAPVASTPSKGSGTKRGAAKDTNGDVDETPTKKRKPAKPRAKKQAVKEEADGEEMDQDENADETDAEV